MARVKRCLGIDLGSHSVKLAEMALDGAGVRIIRMLAETLPVGPDATEEERNNATVNIIKGMMKKNRITTKHVVLCMPGQTVFVRRIRLPRATGSRLHQIILFEARQQIPFPLEKTIVEYQVFDTEKEREVEVLLVAMKRETNEEFMRLVRRIGLQPIGISITSLALFNGQDIQRINFKDISSKSGGGLSGLLGGKKTTKKKSKKDATGEGTSGEGVDAADQEVLADLGGVPAFEEVRAYVNIGARSTDVAVCKPGEGASVGFIRSIPLGGNHVTLAIQKACGLETFTQAETLKIEKTAVLSGSFEFEADKTLYDMDACQAATQICDKLISEVRRSLDYFISQPDGVGVDVVVLSGGSALLGYLTGYVEERIGVPVELSSALGNDQIKCATSYGDEFDYTSFKIAVGLAAQGLGIGRLSVDFLPADVRSMRDFSGQYVEFAALIGFIGAMVFFGSQIGAESEAKYKLTKEKCEGFTQKNTGGIERARLTALESKRSQIESKATVLSDFVTPRDYWLRFLSHVYQSKPARLLLTQVVCQPNYLGVTASGATTGGANSGAPGASSGTALPSSSDPRSGIVWIAGEAEQLNVINTFVSDLEQSKGASPNQRCVVKKATLFRYSSQAEKSEYFAPNPSIKFLIRVEVQDEEGCLLTRLDSQPFMEQTALPAAGAAGMMGGAENGGDPSAMGGDPFQEGRGGGRPRGGPGMGPGR